MSDRDCNYCEWMLLQAKGYTRHEAPFRAFKSGTVILNKEGMFVVWYMLLPERCAC